MQIKRFEAKDMTEALRQVKRALGPDAVILSARDVRRESPLLGISRKVGVEVTAAADNPLPAGAAAPGERALPGRAALTARVQDIVRLGRRPAGPPSAPPATAALQGSAGAAAEVVTRLKAQGVRGHLLERLAAAAADPKGAADPVAALTGCLQALGLTGGAAAAGGQRLLGVVGGPGAGKTTALMKLAAHAQRVLGRATAVATLDAFGLGAAAAWQIFGAVSGIPVAAVGGGRQLKDLLGGWKGYDLVLIDTPGVGAADAERLAWVESQLDGLRSLELHLALPADRREEDLHRLHQQLRRLPLRQALVTRLDETRTLGDLLHHLVNLKLPLSYFSSGQQIPQDLEPATVAALVRRLLDRDPATAAVGAPAAEGEGGPFLANRSSDIFHRPDCRWTAMISPGNRVEFDTFAAALGRSFKPCRYCQPGAAAAAHWNEDAPQARVACGG